MRFFRQTGILEFSKIVTEPNAFAKSLQLTSGLVKKWGKQRPSNGVSPRDLLTVDGISVWDIMEPELALYLVPDALAERSGRRSLRQLFTPYLRPLKYAFWKKSPVNDSDCARWPSGRTALFIGFTSYMARDVLQPVIDLMLRENGLTPVLLSAHSAQSIGGVQYSHSVHCHRSAETVEGARLIAKAIRRASVALTGNDEYRRIFENEGRPLWSQLKHGVKRAFNVTASRLLPDTIAVARHILTDHRPSVIVSIDVADPRTRIYTLLGAALGIPTVQVQSGAVGPEVVEWRFLLDDIVAAQGNQARDVFISHGVPTEKIHVTGSPRYDSLVVADASEIDSFRKRFGVPSGSRTVVFASSYFLAIHEGNLAETAILLRAMKKAIFDAVAETPGIYLIVKPHPLEDVAETRSFVKDHSRIFFAESTEDIRPLTSACDAFFSMGSTTTLDALILGKPTICPAFPGWLISDHFVLSGAVSVPRTENDIVDTLREIAADGGVAMLLRHAAKRNEYLASVVHNGGRGASRRIADLLNTLARPAGREQSTIEKE